MTVPAAQQLPYMFCVFFVRFALVLAPRGKFWRASPTLYCICVASEATLQSAGQHQEYTWPLSLDGVLVACLKQLVWMDVQVQVSLWCTLFVNASSCAVLSYCVLVLVLVV